MAAYSSLPTESAEQRAIITWWRLQFPQYKQLLFHIPNGGKRDIITARNLKKDGVVQGVADLFLSIARAGYHGMYIEMKRRKGGRQSEAQKAFQAEVEREGYAYVVAHGADQARGYIKEYMRDAKHLDTFGNGA